jgi:hypothetical protein
MRTYRSEGHIFSIKPLNVGRQQGLRFKTPVGFANEHPPDQQGRLAGAIPHGGIDSHLLPAGAFPYHRSMVSYLHVLSSSADDTSRVGRL